MFVIEDELIRLEQLHFQHIHTEQENEIKETDPIIYWYNEMNKRFYETRIEIYST